MDQRLPWNLFCARSALCAVGPSAIEGWPADILNQADLISRHHGRLYLKPGTLVRSVVAQAGQGGVQRSLPE